MRRAPTRSGAVVDVSFPDNREIRCAAGADGRRPVRLISVMEGCSKYCSFCVVPYTRGAEVSRPVRDVMREVAQLARQGVREITFLGQNVNAYRGDIDGDHADLAELLHYAAAVPGIERLRFTTSHPVEFSDSLIDAYATLPQLVSHLHLPVQSGSDRILSLMKRGHTILEYKDKIRRARAARPKLSLTSDFIVGFPGETDADFEATLRSSRNCGFDMSFTFLYSRAPWHAGRESARSDAARSETTAARDIAGARAQTRRCGKPRDGRYDATRARHRQREEGREQLQGRTENNRVVNFTGGRRNCRANSSTS